MLRNPSYNFLNKLVGAFVEIRQGYKASYKPKELTINLNFIEGDQDRFDMLPDELMLPACFFQWKWVSRQAYYDTHVRGKGFFDADKLDKFSERPGALYKFSWAVIKYINSKKESMHAKAVEAALTALRYCVRLDNDIFKIARPLITEEQRQFLLL